MKAISLFEADLLKPSTCYGCRHLVQLGGGGNICIHFDPYKEAGTTLDDDRPEPLYEDCYSVAEVAQ